MIDLESKSDLEVDNLKQLVYLSTKLAILEILQNFSFLAVIFNIILPYSVPYMQCLHFYIDEMTFILLN